MLESRPKDVLVKLVKTVEIVETVHLQLHLQEMLAHLKMAPSIVLHPSEIFIFSGLMVTKDYDGVSIPDICHLHHLYVGGEKSVMWRNFRFQYMTAVEKFDISPHAEEFQIFPHNIFGEM